MLDPTSSARVVLPLEASTDTQSFPVIFFRASNLHQVPKVELDFEMAPAYPDYFNLTEAPYGELRGFGR